MAQRNSARPIHPRGLGLERLEPRCVLSANPLFQVRLEVVDLEGNRVEQVEVGNEFEVRMLTKDLRTIPTAKGLFCTFADVVYRDSHVMPAAGNESVHFPGDYKAGPNADLSVPGLIDEIGATAGITPIGLEEVVVATIRFKATAAGTSRFGVNPADNEIQHPILAYGLNYETSKSSNADTAFIGTSLQIIGAEGEVVPDDGWMPADDLVEHNPTFIKIPTPARPVIDPPVSIPTPSKESSSPSNDIATLPIDTGNVSNISYVFLETFASTTAEFTSSGKAIAIPGIRTAELTTLNLEAIRSQRELIFATPENFDLTQAADDQLIDSAGGLVRNFAI